MPQVFLFFAGWLIIMALTVYLCATPQEHTARGTVVLCDSLEHTLMKLPCSRKTVSAVLNAEHFLLCTAQHLPLHAHTSQSLSGRTTACSFFPETNGIPLEEVHYAFNTHWFWRRVLA